MSEDRIAAWRWLLLAHAAALRAIEADLRRAKAIPLTWYDVLLELNAAPDRRLRMQELSDRVVLSRTRVSRLVDELVNEGLVERAPCAEDRRASFAVLTRRGKAELRRTAPVYLAGIEEHFTRLLTASERAVLTTALERVATHHREAASRSQPPADDRPQSFG
jgi:DNA-binding MarR family transcriptional regulator